MAKKDIAKEYILKKKPKKCEVNIHFSVPRDKSEYIFRAEEELRKAGISFDTGALICTENLERDWEFDWSLEGGVEVNFKKFIK